MSEPEPDEFFESDRVFKLDKRNYRQFLEKKDLVMVMFYSTCRESSYDLAPEFAKAAASNDRPNTAFASINCVEQVDLCFRENIKPTMFKFYAKGKDAGVIQDIETVDADSLSKRFVYVATKPSSN